MKEQPTITQKELAERIGKSVRTVKSFTAGGLLVHENGKRNGRWGVTELPDD